MLRLLYVSSSLEESAELKSRNVSRVVLAIWVIRSKKRRINSNAEKLTNYEEKEKRYGSSADPMMQSMKY